MANQSYKVGQVVYVILSNKNIVIPMRVVEEITKRTLAGEETNYVLQSGNSDSDTVLMNQIAGEVFENPDVLNSILTDRASKAIGRMIDNAKKKSVEWFGPAIKQKKEKPKKELKIQTNVDSIDSTVYDERGLPIDMNESQQKIQLDDGTIVNISLPDVLK